MQTNHYALEALTLVTAQEGLSNQRFLARTMADKI